MDLDEARAFEDAVIDRLFALNGRRREANQRTRRRQLRAEEQKSEVGDRSQTRGPESEEVGSTKAWLRQKELA